MSRLAVLFLIVNFFTNFSAAELSFENKEKILAGFVDYLNSLPNPTYTYDDGVLLRVSNAKDNNWNIEARVKANDLVNLDSYKFLKCNSTVHANNEGGVIVHDNYKCEEDVETTPATVPDEELVTVDVGTTISDTPTEHQPVKLDNEVQTDNAATSGEQFIAIPRDKFSSPCIGCSSYVDPQAQGVTTLASLGVTQLDYYEPNIRHRLNKVISVERQVQVVNGVRYVLTLLVDYNTCSTEKADTCVTTKTCKVSILEKPWIKHTDGSKYRSIVSNNCTGDWIFRDGEQFNGSSSLDHDKAGGSPKETPDYNKIPNTGSIDDIITAVHNSDVQSQPGLEKILTEDEMRSIEEQIIPNSQFTHPSPASSGQELTNEASLTSKQVPQVDAAKFISDNSGKIIKNNAISEDKKKTIDDLINFFEYASFNPKNEEMISAARIKRSYGDDLKLFNLAEKFDKMKKSIENAKHLYILAQIMVDYLNEMDLEQKNRILKDVLSAEDESDSNQHFYYVQARVISPCQQIQCDSDDKLIKICSGVIDSTNERNPQVLSVFCYDEKKKTTQIGKINQIPLDDKVLQKLVTTTVKKIETDSPDVNALQVIKIIGANTQKVSGILTRIAFILGHTNCNKTEPIYKRTNCSVSEVLGSKVCNVEILERKWIKDKKITYVCTDRTLSESFGTVKRIDGNKNDRSVIEIVQEALQSLEIQSNRNNKMKVAEIKTVSTQLIAGLLTNIEFSVGYTTCTSDIDVDLEGCEIIKSEPLRNCQVQVWQRPWLEDGRQMNVSCDNTKSNLAAEEITVKNKQLVDDEIIDQDIRQKRQVVGGQTEQNPNDPRFRALAEESLQKYVETIGSTRPHSITKVDKVTTQVVAGSLTRIDFTVNVDNSDVIICHSEVWERPWLKKKDIDVNCQIVNQNSKQKRSVAGAETEQDPNDPRYRALAEESLRKYKQTLVGNPGQLSLSKVDKVTTQVVAGSLTKLDFSVNVDNSDVISCHSEVWERPWLKSKEIDVNCQIVNQNSKQKRSVPGGETEQDPNDPRYRALAEESLQKYKQTLVGNPGQLSLSKVDKVTTQVVAGSLTKLDFSVNVDNSDVISCHSEVWERPWLKSKEIDVNCQIVNQNSKQKRSVPGGETEQDPNDPRYRALAEESLQKYKQTLVGNPGQLSLSKVDKVTTQVVAGSLTKLDFSVNVDNSDVISCHSEVWERPWLKSKEIDVNCQIVNQNSKQKRSVPGGETEQDPNDPRYRALAEESLQKYKQTLVGNPGQLSLSKVDKVTTQVVAGSLTKLDFSVNVDNSDVISCHSEVWERPWLKSKEIDVNCQIVNQNSKQKRSVPGGETEQDPNDPRYRALAEESLQKYKQTLVGNPGQLSLSKVDKVTTQVVAGSLTKLDFSVNVDNSDVISCHSEVWERPWLKSKEIDVNCQIVNQNSKQKRSVAGGETEQDPNDPRYRALAEESLQKYKQTLVGNPGQLSLSKVDKVTTQVVAGSLTKLDFSVNVDNSDVISCHSEVWERPWLKSKEIDVNCQIVNQNSKQKRSVAGGETEQDPNDPRYRALAEESLQKYKQTLVGNPGQLSLSKVDKVTTQVVAGSLTKLDFSVNVDNSDVISCHSEVWERPWLKSKEIDVTCNLINNVQKSRSKRHGDIMTGGITTQDPNDPAYTKLAGECLEQFLKLRHYKQHHQVTRVKTVSTQVVSGSLTRLTFLISPTDCEIDSAGRPTASVCNVVDSNEVQHCSAEVLEMPWKNIKSISVECRPKRNKRQVLGNAFKKHNKRMISRVGSFVDQDATKPKYKQLARDALRKYEQSRHSDVHYEVVEVKSVSSKVVAGYKYHIGFTASPIKCQTNKTACLIGSDTFILHCYTEIWEQAWKHRKNIEVSCNMYDLEEDLEEESNLRVRRGSVSQDKTAYRYHEMAEIATSVFQKSSNSKYQHKVIKIDSVKEEVFGGFLVLLEFTISPTICLIKDANKNNKECTVKNPKVTLSCDAEIQQGLALDFDNNVKVTCDRRSVKNMMHAKTKPNLHNRQKRQNRIDDDNYIDEDTKYYYAERAVKHINDNSRSQNIQKLITVHSAQSSMHMKTQVVRMYIETAYTYCLRGEGDKSDDNCEELDGMGHRLCLAKIFPSSDDELVINRVTVVCEDDEDFARITGLSIPDLVAMSMRELEKSPDVKFKLVHQGEPNVGPSLDLNVPVKVHFVVATTNCSKTINPARDGVACFVDPIIPLKSCLSYVWIVPNERSINQLIVKCKEPKRFKRHVPENPALRNADDLLVQEFVQESLEKLEMSSLHRYKQRVLQINSYSTKITSGKVTTIDFDVGYTNCLKYEWIDNVTKCEFLEHLPRRHCVSQVWERLWLKNGRNIEVNCEDDETPLESRIDFESAETAMQLANQALKHIEAKYPHPQKQQVVRIFSLEKQLVAGVHFRMKIEVGFTNCTALSTESNCQVDNDGLLNRFCRVNVWIRPWTDHPPNFRVSCDFQEGVMGELSHMIQAEQLFFNFLTTYKPDYINDHIEMQKRFEIFRANVRKIHELNTHERGTATYAVNQFADLTEEEFKTKYTGLKPSLQDPNAAPMADANIPDIVVPEKFDWRLHGAVTDVKDQGSCGSCWAFSVTGNIEGQWKLQNGELISLSEQELVDCDKLDDGCNGGLPDNAYRAIEQLGGLESESDYPYDGADDTCTYNKTMSKVQIRGAVNISSDEAKMAQWLVKNGPMSIGINANAMQFYVGGVSHPWKVLCSPTNLDHGVLIVGYGIKEYPLFHKRLPYWIVKNSWGKSWGEQGYYRVYRGDGTCGVNKMVSSAVV